MSFVTSGHKSRNLGDQTFCVFNRPQLMAQWKAVRFWFWPFNLGPHSVLLSKNAINCKKVILFFILRGYEKGPGLWHIWIGDGWIFSLLCLSSILAICMGKQGVKVEAEKQALVFSHIRKKINFGEIIQTIFIF